MPTVDVSGGNIFYQVEGRGEPLLMLRGLGRSSRYWLGFDKMMSQHFKVITLDHRGLGRSTAPLHWNSTIEDLAVDVATVLDHAGIESAHVFGLSLGGMVAMALAAEVPDRCRTLIVANSSSADYIHFRVNPISVAKIALAAAQGKIHEDVKRYVTTSKIDGRIGHEIGEQWGAIMEDEGFPIETIAKQLLASLRFRIRGRLDGRLIPTLILYGNQDQFVPRGNSQHLHRLIPHSNIQVIRGVGHEISVGHEDLLCSLICQFTEKLKQAS
ncbi:alpha/beta fold hydrolase [Pseudobacteriovorax antillogorgiicola]|uniref:3-oxoadipate enol-lactonase n=1 Tax=Pseudobacteriovorax antillogorgiicola TaxID=1513793 RepID=A0A1Y6CMC9_9BACT|nr:alpha/beta hydrolase [Pseudobacteriovorax antillogorgiicola]TCS47300.1 3-oxoadipate enol-lactonase [Pseudobacteriovorax antillogorgiicola]SMF62498.1 3-oxoadipate enol-lactonase [Pseudobacteriovorax antillogorgiicola]